MSRRSLLVLFFASVGVLAGVGAFTFGYAKGLSYLSTDPRACANCHIMNDQYAAWLKSGHRHTATCVECHLPASGLTKWTAKADHGFRHSVAFTLQNFKEPIEITPKDRAIAQANCLRCHGDFVQAVHPSPGPPGRDLDCMHC
ncbi:MAG: cytochrome c nitrite reductase small subunit, partial [Candidatus Rokuibacteriota bacterium]